MATREPNVGPQTFVNVNPPTFASCGTVDHMDTETEPTPGTIWMAVVGAERRRSSVVLMRPVGSGWQVVGLTTSPSYGDGSPRVEVPSLGGGKRSYLWSTRTHTILAGDLVHPVGPAPTGMLRAIAEHVDVEWGGVS